MHRDFVVTVSHAMRPLAAVSVEVWESTGPDGVRRFSGKTDASGKLRVSNLPPGEYWLKAELFGITAAYECFHVASTPSRKAKRAVSYEWGELAQATRRLAGKVLDCQPGEGPNRLLNLARCAPVPVVGAAIKLQDPSTFVTQNRISDDSGTFDFGAVPNGTYALHVEGGKALKRDYDAADLLVQLSPAAEADTIVMTRREASAGSCGGTDLEVKMKVYGSRGVYVFDRLSRDLWPRPCVPNVRRDTPLQKSRR